MEMDNKKLIEDIERGEGEISKSDFEKLKSKYPYFQLLDQIYGDSENSESKENTSNKDDIEDLIYNNSSSTKVEKIEIHHIYPDSKSNSEHLEVEIESNITNTDNAQNMIYGKTSPQTIEADESKPDQNNKNEDVHSYIYGQHDVLPPSVINLSVHDIYGVEVGENLEKLEDPNHRDDSTTKDLDSFQKDTEKKLSPEDLYSSDSLGVSKAKSLTQHLSFRGWLNYLSKKSTEKKQEEEKISQIKAHWQKAKLESLSEEELEPIDDGVFEMVINSVKEDDELISEPLANLYVKQGHKDKAIHIYEKLILKYPEKSSYFGDLISKLNQ